VRQGFDNLGAFRVDLPIGNVAQIAQVTSNSNVGIGGEYWAANIRGQELVASVDGSVQRILLPSAAKAPYIGM